jgi:hypothetical protein
MKFDVAQKRAIAAALQAFPLDGDKERLEDFVARAISLGPLAVERYFPAGGSGQGPANAAEVTAVRTDMVEVRCQIPSYVFHLDRNGRQWIEGLATSLAAVDVTPQIRSRLTLRDSVRARVRAFSLGSELETLGAALFAAQIGDAGRGFATQRSHDGGVDVVGLRNLAMSRLEFSSTGLRQGWPRTSPTLFVVGSAKCEETPGIEVALASRAHVRELVGTWAMQRTSVGRWSRLGIKPLSPVVPVFITTYRLSYEAMRECEELGIEVWGIPQLVWLVIALASELVFPTRDGQLSFDLDAFDRWWRSYEGTRVSAAKLAELGLP